MLGSITRWLSRKSPRENVARYVLPTDDPELTPITVADESTELSPQDIGPMEDAIARAPTTGELKQGLGELAVQVRALGQRVQAQNIGHERLLAALEAMPAALKGALPAHAGQAEALRALQAALAANAAANARLCQAVEPLARASANMPLAAKEQLAVLQQVAKQGRRQLAQQRLALRAGRQALAAQRRHHVELETTQQARLAAMQHQNAQGLFTLEKHVRRGARMHFAAACAALLVASAALIGVISRPELPAQAPVTNQAEQERRVPADSSIENPPR